LFGVPHAITTVDQYQGQQNDYVLLSLVRTKNVGHIRDIRRLVVALSRAKFGLYVFARVKIFQQCFELKHAFDLLLKRPQKLHLVTNEPYSTQRLLTDTVTKADENEKTDEKSHEKLPVERKIESFALLNLNHMCQIVKFMADSVRMQYKREYETQLQYYHARAQQALEEKRRQDAEEAERQRAQREKEEREKAELEELEKNNKKETVGADVDMDANVDVDATVDANVDANVDATMDENKDVDKESSDESQEDNSQIDKNAKEDADEKPSMPSDTSTFAAQTLANANKTNLKEIQRDVDPYMAENEDYSSEEESSDSD